MFTESVLPNTSPQVSPWQRPGQEPSPLQSGPDAPLVNRNTFPSLPRLCCFSYALSCLTKLSHLPRLAFYMQQQSYRAGGHPNIPAVLCNPSNPFACSKRIMKGKSNPVPAALEPFPNLLSWANLRKGKVTKTEQLCPIPQAPGIYFCYLIHVASQIFALISSCCLGRDNPFNPAA